jgi:hypothetical protein
MHSKSDFMRITSSLLVGMSISIFYWIGSFVAGQSRSVFRNFQIAPVNLILYIPIGVAVAFGVYWFIRKSEKSFFGIGVVSLVVALFFWWLVSLSAVQQFILPEATVK